ncbi:peptidoglycan DD-metalloendopeptidase family protein [Mesonia sp. K7]|uniref:M23 family metallopeptidase n=1 Tax=Mesonia sp. K7 TaxID=2218606 RepID=UPI000DA80622|nr:peptidoglycan DD-metalloendopeptidase family protein [Mesonia sp. K7]PZD78476.1 M23 family peptidase [Mesonia sp. K7]
MKSIFFFLSILFCLISVSCEEDKSPKITKVVEVKQAPLIKEYGFILNNYEVYRDTVRSGDSFGAIMDTHGVPASKVYNIINSVKDNFSPRKIIAGKPYTILKAKDSVNSAKVFIYEYDRVNYAVVHLGDSLYAESKKRPVAIKQKVATGVITSSLSQAMTNAGMSVILADKMADIYQWKIDFFRIQKGDQFKLVYKEKYINDTIYAGIESVEAAVLKHSGKEYYAYRFVKDSLKKEVGYYDEEGKSLQNFFLKAPLKFSRISSRYTKRRFHPVQKRWKAHKGTDYAAPHGTPIWSTANGVVIKSSYTRGNGNYVKVKHNDKYTTQYLHMSKRAVKVGQRVNQGDIIGYVGSTGLATGPHVCYRFWVYGKQVDPYKQNLPSAEPLEDRLKSDFFFHVEPAKKMLQEIKYKEI